MHLSSISRIMRSAFAFAPLPLPAPPIHVSAPEYSWRQPSHLGFYAFLKRYGNALLVFHLERRKDARDVYLYGSFHHSPHSSIIGHCEIDGAQTLR